MRKGYHILTFGCQMNERDSEMLAGILYEIGYRPTGDIEDADLILLNTCCVRETAENKIWGRIGELKALKQFIEGSVSGNFQSSKPATREWAIKLIIKSMGLQQEAAAKAGVDLPFRDRDIIPDDAVGYIAVALENGIITGFPDGTFKPNKPVTRAQIATMLGSTASELPIPGKLKNKVEGTVLSVSTVPAVVSETVYERTYSQGTITIDTGKEDDDEDEDRDEDEDEDEDEDNRVTGTVTYPVAANALIYVDGRKASLDLVAVGAEAELVVKNGLAVFIEVEPVTVKGVVYAVYAPENRLDIMPKEREKRMIIRSYTVADNGVIMLNGTDSALTEILPGDVVKLTLDKDGKAAQVKATRLLKPEKVRDKDEEKERHRERDKEKNRDRGQDKMKDKNDDNDEHEEDD